MISGNPLHIRLRAWVDWLYRHITWELSPSTTSASGSLSPYLRSSCLYIAAMCRKLALLQWDYFSQSSACVPPLVGRAIKEIWSAHHKCVKCGVCQVFSLQSYWSIVPFWPLQSSSEMRCNLRCKHCFGMHQLRACFDVSLINLSTENLLSFYTF